MSASAVSDALNAMLSDDAVRDRMRAGDSSGFDLNAEERDLVRAAAADCPEVAEVAGFAAVDYLPSPNFNFTDASSPLAYQTGGSGFQKAALYCRKAGGEQ
jgi:hypothetical protein